MKKIVSFFGLGVLLGLILLVGIVRLVWHSKFYPGVTIATVEVGGLTREQAKVKLENKIADYQMNLTFNESEWKIPKELIGFDLDSSLNEGYRYGRRLIIADYLLLLINKQTDYPLQVQLTEAARWDEWMEEIVPMVEIAPNEPSVTLEKNKIVVVNGSDGVIIDRELLKQRVGATAAKLKTEKVEIPTKKVDKQLNGEQLQLLASRGNKLLEKNLILVLDDEQIKLTTKELISLLYTGKDEEIFDSGLILQYVGGLGESLDRPPQDAKFEFSEGKVKEFAPGKDGVKVEAEQTAQVMKVGLIKLVTETTKTENVQIAVKRTAPLVTTDKVNELGIKERIGRGESYYAHSIPNRIYNVGLAAGRIQSALIPPGEEVSFNKLVGEVSGATGYRSAYIISGGRTVLGDGGGLCQVSTTMFRAAMAAGLPILERWAHSYRVSYYELNSKPGVDATVIAPSKDFRFKNDTPGHILIQTINDPKKLFLVIEIYGTNDGRVATISEPKVWGISPPPPNIYQDDPTLPAGVMKQVDWSAWGAKASFEYKVVRNGETLQEKTFSSAYRPWANVYLRGTGAQ
ncbi:MAG: VanW family protein [bacterium]